MVRITKKAFANGAFVCVVSLPFWFSHFEEAEHAQKPTATTDDHIRDS